MKSFNVFWQVENMQREEEHPWRWLLLVAAADLICGMLASLLFEANAPILITGFHFCLIWISGLVGFYRNQWFFGWDYNLPRKQWLISILCVCPVLPIVQLFSQGILDFLCKSLIGCVFCLLSYGVAAVLGEKYRKNRYEMV